MILNSTNFYDNVLHVACPEFLIEEELFFDKSEVIRLNRYFFSSLIPLYNNNGNAIYEATIGAKWEWVWNKLFFLILINYGNP